MAVKPHTSVNKGAGVNVYTWVNMQENDTGEPIQMPASADKTVHADGVFGVGGSVTMQGSNNNVAYGALNDADGTAVALTADTIVQMVRENPLFIRPAVTAGDGNTDLIVTLVVKRTT